MTDYPTLHLDTDYSNRTVLYSCSTFPCQIVWSIMSTYRTHTDTHAHAPKIQHYMTRLELTTTKLATNKAICLKTKKNI
jgi:hypothetical protein